MTFDDDLYEDYSSSVAITEFEQGVIIHKLCEGYLLDSWWQNRYADGASDYNQWQSSPILSPDEQVAQFEAIASTMREGETLKLKLLADGMYEPILPSNQLTESSVAAHEAAKDSIHALKQKTTQRRPYTPPRLVELAPVHPAAPATVWELKDALTGWGFAGVYDLYDFLISAKGAGASLNSLIVFVGGYIAGCFSEAAAP